MARAAGGGVALMPEGLEDGVDDAEAVALADDVGDEAEVAGVVDEGVGWGSAPPSLQAERVTALTSAHAAYVILRLRRDMTEGIPLGE